MSVSRDLKALYVVVFINLKIPFKQLKSLSPHNPVVEISA